MSGVSIQGRINCPVSDAELSRRWAEIRRAMEAAKIDVLVAHSDNDFMGGYVKYLTDLPATNGYSVTVIFPREDLMTVVMQGAFGTDVQSAGIDPVRRGVKRILGSPSYVSIEYTLAYDTELVRKALAGFEDARIGILGGTFPFRFADDLRTHLLRKGSIFAAGSVIDPIKNRKSAEELSRIRDTAAMQDGAMQRVVEEIRPGMTDNQIGAIAEKFCRDAGSEQGVYLCSSSPVGVPTAFTNRHLQNRTLQSGDAFHLLIESAGPAGYYAELGRTIVLGRASESMQHEFQFALDARQRTLALLKPGAHPKEIWNAFNDHMQSNGRPPEDRLFCHGQGYDMVERPLVRFDEPEPLISDLNMSCHPTYRAKDSLAWVCDNYWISVGPAERLHQFPEAIVEVDP